MRHFADFRPKALSLTTLVWTLLLMIPWSARGDAPPFDLAGPKIDVHVQRQGRTLAIAEVPNLLPGDRLWIHPDLPESQSARYILIVAFLRGSTNPPPADWFRRVETWLPAVRQEGVFVVVPAEAQQALLFLAPETGGDFSTLRKAVQGRPGAFVRATQDLQMASWDRLRLDAYLADVKTISLADPKLLKERTELAARSLGIRVDQQCFDKPTEQQAPCLVQHTDGLVLDDSNAQSAVMLMANGPAGDMMSQLSYAPLAGAGTFSPYVGAVVDLARILSTIHTAKYQYIPALALPQKEQQDTLNLRLNVPPSFRDPKSVIVVALPPIGPSHLPQLHPPEPAQGAATAGGMATEPAAATGPAGIGPSQFVPAAYCAAKPGLALAAEGAPLVFATAMAHDLTLHIETRAKVRQATAAHPELPEPDMGPGMGAGTGVPPDSAAGSPAAAAGAVTANTPAAGGGIGAGQEAGRAETGIDVAVRPDPTLGGFVLERPLPALPEAEAVAELRGQWGFDTWTGPKIHLISPHSGGWSILAADQNALITGREDTLHITGGSTLCVADVRATLREGKGRHTDLKVPWKAARPDLLDVSVPLKDAGPGTVTIAIREYGLPQPEELPLKAYAEAASVEHFTLSVGDKVAVLKGKRLDEVESAELEGIDFTPAALNRVEDFDQLELAAAKGTAALEPGTTYQARVTLRDGRALHVAATVSAARPQIELISKGVQPEETADAATVRLDTASNPNDLPLQRRLVFFLRSRVPANFPRAEKIEIRAVDGSFGTTLSLADGSLILEDAHTAVATLDALARFGASAFGPIQLRAVSPEGVTGDWVPLGTLVRLPGFTPGNALRCPRNVAKPCLLTGSNLFLITAVGTTQDMANAVDVPAEFSGASLPVPNTARTAANGASATLYLRLRDDPDSVETVSLPLASPPAASAAPSVGGNGTGSSAGNGAGNAGSPDAGAAQTAVPAGNPPPEAAAGASTAASRVSPITPH